MPFWPPQILPSALYPLLQQGLKTLFPGALWDLPPDPQKRQVALTFDDGPHPEYTPTLLQVLQEFQVPATFFVLGERVQRWPHLARKIRQQSHGIGLHGWQHRSFTQLSRGELLQSLRRSQDTLVAACGGTPEEYRAVRPPQRSLLAPDANRLALLGVSTGDVECGAGGLALPAGGRGGGAGAQPSAARLPDCAPRRRPGGIPGSRGSPPFDPGLGGARV
jgi:peptidoglycan/xylan/chitin deacetylase (PgdA/CDA1 family)